MTTAVKRACDACHRRKVKCDGINPCRNCSSAQLSCTYNAIPQKKGPKGSRAKVISELRETQRQTLTSRQRGIGPAAIPSLAPTPGLLTNEMVKHCLDYFFENMYSTMPILIRQRLEQQAMFPENLDAYCLLTSLCAMVLLQPGMTLPGADPYAFDAVGANMLSTTLLMDETIRVRKGLDYLSSPTHNAICTSYFLYACHHILDLQPKAFFHLREATTLAQMVDMHKEETYLTWDALESSRRRRLYWLLFIAERTQALRRRRPLTLPATINSPNMNDDPTDPFGHQLNNFIMTVNVFRPLDDQLVNAWNKTQADFSSLTPNMQKSMGEATQNYLTNDSSFAEPSRNQQWLKNMNWQIHVTQATKAGDMSYQYPVDVSHELLSMASSLPVQGMDILSVSLITKVLTIAADLTDYLPMQAASRTPYGPGGPREQLAPLLNLIAMIRSGEHRFMPLLLGKVHEIMARLNEPKLLNTPESAVTNMCANIDIFDGFGNAGMAQPPCLPTDGLPADSFKTEYGQSQPDFKPESNSPSGSSIPSSGEVNPSHSGSPPMVSPGLEFAHSMPADFAPMTEMVMSPMGPGPGSSISGPPGQQHASMQGLSGMTQQLTMNPTVPSMGQGQVMNGLMHQGFNNGLTPMSQPLPSNGMVSRPQPSRSNSFAIQQQPQITVGDFQALQRANTDIGTISMNMGAIGQEFNFNTNMR